MAVITFWGNNKIETMQTTSMAAIAIYMSLEQNSRNLIINAKYNDTNLQECFWGQNKKLKNNIELETGISGLMRAISTNKATPEIITNYTKTVFTDRLEILTDSGITKEDFQKQRESMPTILKMADKFYDLVFVDIEGNPTVPGIKNILESSDVIVVNTTQRIKYIKEFQELRKMYDVFKKDNLIYLIGRYDRFSKYNVKNLHRAVKVDDMYAIPYNTLFFEACNDGTLVDFVINYRRDRNGIQLPIMESIDLASQGIINKLKELQMEG